MPKGPPKARKAQQVFLVEDVSNAPGRIYAVFADEEDANWFANAISDDVIQCEVVTRTLQYGQPSIRGYNP